MSEDIEELIDALDKARSDEGRFITADQAKDFHRALDRLRVYSQKPAPTPTADAELLERLTVAALGGLMADSSTQTLSQKDLAETAVEYANETLSTLRAAQREMRGSNA